MIAQTAILILSTLAIWLLSGKRPSRWAWVIGLSAQPFWAWETWHAQQWGMLVLTMAYAGIYARGLRNHWRPAP